MTNEIAKINLPGEPHPLQLKTGVATSLRQSISQPTISFLVGSVFLVCNCKTLSANATFSHRQLMKGT